MTGIVRESYRRNSFDEWRTHVVGDPRARVLELGCGLEPEGDATFRWILARS